MLRSAVRGMERACRYSIVQAACAPVADVMRECGMHADIAAKRQAVAALCRRHGVSRLEGFGSAARGTDFDPAHSDADFLVTFLSGASTDLVLFADFKDALEALLDRPVVGGPGCRRAWPQPDLPPENPGRGRAALWLIPRRIGMPRCSSTCWPRHATRQDWSAHAVALHSGRVRHVATGIGEGDMHAEMAKAGGCCRAFPQRPSPRTPIRGPWREPGCSPAAPSSRDPGSEAGMTAKSEAAADPHMTGRR